MSNRLGNANEGAADYGSAVFLVEESDGSAVRLYAERMEISAGALIFWGGPRGTEPQIVAAWSPGAWHSAAPASPEGMALAIQSVSAPQGA